MKAELMGLGVFFFLVSYAISYADPAAEEGTLESISVLNKDYRLSDMDEAWQPGQGIRIQYALPAALGGITAIYFILHRKRESCQDECDHF